MSMSRRTFGRFAATGAAATAVTAVQAQPAAPTIRWRLTSSFPKSVDALWGASTPAAYRLTSVPSDAGTVLMHADNRRVNHLNGDVMSAGRLPLRCTCPPVSLRRHRRRSLLECAPGAGQVEVSDLTG